MKDWALVTGASGAIGAAVAVELAAAGHPVVVNYRSNEAGARAAADRISTAGGLARAARFDVADRRETREALRTLADEQVEIGVVVHNAAVVRDRMFAEMADEEWDDVVGVTLGGFYNVVRPLVLPMVRRRRGRVICVSSASALYGVPGQVNYGAAKAALIGATRALAREVGSRGVTVNAVAPGWIDTPMTAHLDRAAISGLIALRRMGTPEEVAKLVRFLAGDDAAYITGQVVEIDGGLR